jgi:hypothetical protein
VVHVMMGSVVTRRVNGWLPAGGMRIFVGRMVVSNVMEKTRWLDFYR